MEDAFLYAASAMLVFMTGADFQGSLNTPEIFVLHNCDSRPFTGSFIWMTYK